ncbi:MAG TPA: rhomboid family intramembrane serine protease [Gaiellaceae bacterium]|nr:rhomboid family intramembrane serine protease [Gaiellaceae bacterium]
MRATLPLTDLVRLRRFPLVTVALVAANVLVWLGYQVPRGLDTSVTQLGFRPCEATGACADTALPWAAQAATSMFAHGGWSHLAGNLVFLGAFAPRLEDRLGRLDLLGLYLAAGLAATGLDAVITLALAPADIGEIPSIGASGAISGVVGAYVILYPFERVLTWVVPALFLRIPALGLLGAWFALQLLEGAYTLGHPDAFVGIAFFAHVGGFATGALATFALAGKALHRGPPAARPA